MTQAMEETFQQILRETRVALRERSDVMRALVARLMEQEEMLADEVKAFFDQYGLFTPEPTIVKDGEEIKLLPDEVFTPPKSPLGQASAKS
jgi:hypothetical protein